ncbi:MAG: coproporphyrinogen III oxidase [Verrucomicrobia bacterium]|nr:coproporphyrinogen III oxidase [Verrucomicrobiota bacterium]
MNLDLVRNYLLGLQDRLCALMEEVDGKAKYHTDEWKRAEGGGGRTRVIAGGTVLEKGGVAFSDVRGHALPPSATLARPDLAGKYGFDEDAISWHQAAKAATGSNYLKFKKGCDDYFILKHRGEARGIGGIFYDDFTEGGFENAFALMQKVGDAYGPAYAEILGRRKDTPFGARETEWHEIRRGRYVEFNLVFDRGTIFGLQSGGRTESILMSLPPRVQWRYCHQPAAGTPEERLISHYLKPQDWLAGS